MAKQRVVNTYFWNDPFILKLRADEKLLFLYALTNPQTDLCGAYELAMEKIVFETKLSERKILETFGKFEAAGKMIYRDGWVIIKNFAKHQQGNSPNVIKGAARALSACPDWVKQTLTIGFQAVRIENALLPIPVGQPRPEPEPLDTHVGVGDEIAWAYPMKNLVDAFPEYLNGKVTPAMIGFIEAEVLPGDESAWDSTVRDYRMNFNTGTGSYLPDKTANVLGVFRKYKSEASKQNGSNKKSNTGRQRNTGNARSDQTTGDYLASIGANPKM